MHWRNSDFKIYQVKKVAKTPHLYTQKAQQTVSTATQTVSETSSHLGLAYVHNLLLVLSVVTFITATSTSRKPNVLLQNQVYYSIMLPWLSEVEAQRLSGSLKFSNVTVY